VRQDAVRAYEADLNMALALTVDAIDSVPEAQRALYVEKEGKYHLDVDGLPDVSGLKTALEKERAANKANAKDIAAWKGLGKSADEIAALVAEKEAAAEEALKKAGKHDQILADKLAQAARERKEEADALRAERDAANADARQAIVETRVTTALTKAKATQEGLDLLAERLGKRIKVEMVNGKRVTSIMQADGETPMIGSEKDGSANFDDLVKEAVKTYPSLFEGTGAGGSGTDQKNQRRDAGAKTITLADFHALGPIERAAKMKEGFKVVD
jgi:hypothetical protein